MVVSKATTDIMVAYGLGSCVAVCLYDPLSGVGGMLHALLPDAPGNPAGEANPAKFVKQGVPLLLEAVTKLGANKSRLVVRLCGGAQMLTAPGLNNTLNIGERNVATAEEVLKQLGLRIKDQITGGHAGRTVKLFVNGGKITVKTLGQGEQILE
jgi:chemotaxis protein CheD